jgi:pimeloyl-ACP methyl ester carboxylesterase
MKLALAVVVPLLITVPVSIPSGTATLAGEIFMPDPPVRGLVPGAVVVHGSGTGPRSNYRMFASRLNAMGVAVLIYDKRGVGDSTGDYFSIGVQNSISGLGQLADDANRAVATLAAHKGVDPKRIGLIGMSQAGWIIPIAAAKNPAVSFMVVLSGPAVSTGFEIFHGRITRETEQNPQGIDPVVVARQLAEYKGPVGYDPMPTLRAIKTPTLWIMGERDRNLPIKETLAALDTLPGKASGLVTLVRLPNADHGLNNVDGTRTTYWDTVKSWLSDRKILR